jgi:5-methyltetrahydropteroyltriglutamate--homocysteine methyltransferase
MIVCMHLCRGNFAGAWVAEGGYDLIAEVLFNEIAVDGYFLEYDSPRAGSFAPLRFLPKGKIAVLGLSRIAATAQAVRAAHSGRPRRCAV